MSLPTTEWILPAGENPGSSGEKLLKSLQDQILFSFPRFTKQKNISVFQQETFSIKETLKFEPQTLVTLFIIDPLTFIHAGTYLTTGVFWSSQ